LFPTLKEFLGGRLFKDDEEVKYAIKQCLKALAAEVYNEGRLITSQTVTCA
jgi:hypothetical protein